VLFAEAVACGADATGFGADPLFLSLAPRALAGVDPRSPAGFHLRGAMLGAASLLAPPGHDPVAAVEALLAEADEDFLTWFAPMAPLFWHSSPDLDRANAVRSAAGVMAEIGGFWTEVRRDVGAAGALADAALARQGRLGRNERNELDLAIFHQARALAELAMGDLPAAELDIAEVERWAKAEPMFAAGIPWQRMVLARWRGDDAAVTRSAATAWTAMPYYPRLVDAFGGGLLRLDQGDHAAATEGFARAWADGPATIGRDWTYTGTISALAELAVGLGRAEEAAVLDEVLAPFDGQFMLDTCIHLAGSAAWLRAGLARCRGELDLAVERYERAEAFESVQGTLPLLARTRRDLGDTLLQRRAAGDVERARGLLTTAATDATRLGLRRIARTASSSAAEAV
jgi:hypothetical protein